MGTTPTIAIDLRNARSDKTRANICEALLHLLEEGHHQPSAQLVAKRANVSIRALFHHFHGMEGLYTEVVGTQTHHMIGTLVAVPAKYSTLSKARRSVAMYDDWHSLAAPLHTCIRFNAARNWEHVGAALQLLRQALSAHVRQSFAVEISRHRNPHDVTTRLEAVNSFEMWDHFRRVQGCTRHDTRIHMLTLLMDVLGA